MVDRAKNVIRTLTCLSPPVKDERHNDWFKTRNPDQTPVRLQLLQSGYGLFHSPLQNMLSNAR